MQSRDPDYEKYLESHPGATWHDYNVHCSNEWDKWMKDQLQKHLDRNLKFFKSHPELSETFMWIQEFMKNLTDSHREELGDEIMDARMKVMAKYNSLMIEFARNDFDEEAVIAFLTGAKTQREILEK